MNKIVDIDKYNEIVELLNSRKEQTVKHYNNREFYGDMTKQQKIECMAYPLSLKFKVSILYVVGAITNETNIYDLLDDKIEPNSKQYDTEKKYTVWVDGTKVIGIFVDEKTAIDIEAYYRKRGYTDVYITKG